MIKECWKTKNAIKLIKQQLPEKSIYYSSEIQLNKETYLNDSVIKKINSEIKLLEKEYIIGIYNENPESTSQYLNFYGKLTEENLISKNFATITLSNEIIDEEDELEEMDENLIPKGDDKKIAKILDDYYKQESMEEHKEVCYYSC